MTLQDRREIFSRELGLALRRIRKRAKLTQAEIADVAGLSKNTIVEIEIGGTTRADSVILYALALENYTEGGQEAIEELLTNVHHAAKVKADRLDKNGLL